MANDNSTWNGDFRRSHMSENSTEYSNGARPELGADSIAYVESLQAFPTWITNSIFLSIYALGILANTVLLVYIIYYKRYKTPVFCVILSLGIADLGMCVGCVLLYSLVVPFIIGPLWLCHVAAVLTYVSYLSSTYHIAVFAVLRFLQLVHPLTSYAKVTTGLMTKICLTIWSLHSIQAFIFGFYFETYNMSTTGTNDLYVCIFTGNRQVRALWTMIFWIVMPFLTMSGLHVAKHVILVFSRSPIVTSSDKEVKQVRRQTDTRAIAVVIAVYLVTVLPYLVQTFRIYVLNISDNLIEVYLVQVFFQVNYMNSAINPCIYLFAAESVRSEIRKMVICNRHTQNKRTYKN